MRKAIITRISGGGQRRSLSEEGFTLAEVLITLGIIGIVASLTLPALIQKYTNHVVEVRLEKFYSMINQAIARAEADYGDRTYWFEEAGGWNEDQTEHAKLEWAKKYLLPYLKGVNYTFIKTSQQPIFFLPDGTAFGSVNGAEINRDWLFWTSNPETKCTKWNGTNGYDDIGVCAFPFFYSPDSADKVYKGKGLEPWRAGWDGTVESLYSECKNKDRSYNRPCAAIIQFNGWKIPKDYPYKVHY